MKSLTNVMKSLTNVMKTIGKISAGVATIAVIYHTDPFEIRTVAEQIITNYHLDPVTNTMPPAPVKEPQVTDLPGIKDLPVLTPPPAPDKLLIYHQYMTRTNISLTNLLDYEPLLNQTICKQGDIITPSLYERIQQRMPDFENLCSFVIGEESPYNIDEYLNKRFCFYSIVTNEEITTLNNNITGLNQEIIARDNSLDQDQANIKLITEEGKGKNKVEGNQRTLHMLEKEKCKIELQKEGMIQIQKAIKDINEINEENSIIKETSKYVTSQYQTYKNDRNSIFEKYEISGKSDTSDILETRWKEDYLTSKFEALQTQYLENLSKMKSKEEMLEALSIETKKLKALQSSLLAEDIRREGVLNAVKEKGTEIISLVIFKPLKYSFVTFGILFAMYKFSWWFANLAKNIITGSAGGSSNVVNVTVNPSTVTSSVDSTEKK